MVSTRNHPQAFPPPLKSPSKSPSKTSSPAATPSPSQSTFETVSRKAVWSHTPSLLTLFWLCVSLPLVTWDFSYVFLRPHSMPGGRLQWPLYVPYELYGQVDYVYGWPAYNTHNGFNAAQSSMNVVETVAYSIYLYLVFTQGRTETTQGTGAPAKKYLGKLSQSRAVYGKYAAYSVVLLNAAAVMTLSKTILYWLNEAFSGFANVGHNDFTSLFFLWVVPNGAWIAFPIYITYVSTKEIVRGLEAAAAGDVKKLQ